MKIRFAKGAVSAGALAADCGGILLAGSDANCPISGICTDSSEADADTAFLALRGRRTDGHCFAEAAIATGCRCVICERPVGTPQATILTENSESALLRLANTVRRRLSCRVAAVTGSVGKTTTKEMIGAVLSESRRTFKTPGNHNSTVGMPLAMLEMPADTEWAVLEMGMNAPGEIRRLSLAAEPDFAIITNVGTAHIGLLGSRENILRAKAEILSGLRPDGVFFRNADDDLISTLDGKNFRTVSLSIHGRKADFSAKNIRVEPEQTRFDAQWRGGTEKDLCIRFAGVHHVYAALFAFAVGIEAGVSTDRIREGLYSCLPDSLRQTRTEIAGVTLIEDCYNASPESMRAALEVLDVFCSDSRRRGIAVLGDMFELGAQSEALHRAVGKRFAEGRAELLFTVGQGGSMIAEGARANGVSSMRICENPGFDDLSPLVAALCQTVRAGDVILIKASRAVAAERAGSALKTFLMGREGRSHA